ncbi:hypothetical protein BT69DRAFT_1330303 [Atractiella rhizophila]|nr:hypothetical protein BT69DRAFT_1330303 [Atractiella rhizophila]
MAEYHTHTYNDRGYHHFLDQNHAVHIGSPSSLGWQQFQQYSPDPDSAAFDYDQFFSQTEPEDRQAICDQLEVRMRSNGQTQAGEHPAAYPLIFGSQSMPIPVASSHDVSESIEEQRMLALENLMGNLNMSFPEFEGLCNRFIHQKRSTLPSKAQTRRLTLPKIQTQFNIPPAHPTLPVYTLSPEQQDMHPSPISATVASIFDGDASRATESPSTPFMSPFKLHPGSFSLASTSASPVSQPLHIGKFRLSTLRSDTNEPRVVPRTGSYLPAFRSRQGKIRLAWGNEDLYFAFNEVTGKRERVSREGYEEGKDRKEEGCTTSFHWVKKVEMPFVFLDERWIVPWTESQEELDCYTKGIAIVLRNCGYDTTHQFTAFHEDCICHPDSTTVPDPSKAKKDAFSKPVRIRTHFGHDCPKADSIGLRGFLKAMCDFDAANKKHKHPKRSMTFNSTSSQGKKASKRPRKAKDGTWLP